MTCSCMATVALGAPQVLRWLAQRDGYNVYRFLDHNNAPNNDIPQALYTYDYGLIFGK